MDQEKQHLLKGKHYIPENKPSPHYTQLSLLLVFLVTYLISQTESVMSYVLNEWIHHTLKEKLVPNVSVSYDIPGCSSLNHSREIYTNLTKVQQDSARWMMYNSVAQYTPAFFSSIILTAYTDKFGRKMAICTFLAGYLLSVVLILLVMYTNQNFIYIVLANVVEGSTGALYTFYSTLSSVIADLVNDSKKRVLAVVSLEFISMLAVTVAAFISGILVEAIGYQCSTILCLGSVIATLILTFLLPETLRQEYRTNPGSVIGILKRPLEFYTSSDFKGEHLVYILFMLAFGVAEVAGLNRTSLETVYFLGAPFCWSPEKIGYFTSARHIGQTVIGLGSVKFMQQCWSNEFIAVFSTVSGAASYVIEGLVTSDVMIFTVAVVGVFSFLTTPMIRGIMSTLAPEDKQGSMFASLAGIQVIGSIIAVTTENNIYSATVSIMNGFVFLVMAGFCTLEFILLILGSHINRRKQELKE